jgi:hypothetical protein
MALSIELRPKMVEYLQNCTPSFLVEIGRAKEVEATRRGKYCHGFVPLPQAHRSVIHNKEVRGLARLFCQTKKHANNTKIDWWRLKPDNFRAGPTIFDIVVDAIRGCNMPSVGVV